jgi:hypothetical protein
MLPLLCLIRTQSVTQHRARAWGEVEPAPAGCLQVDIAIVEAGLGGARDATNMFSAQNLKLAIVTAIGLEHQRVLGDTLEVCLPSS